jgi:hypothetical protein
VEETAQPGVKSELELESESKSESELKDWLRFLVGLTIDADSLGKCMVNPYNVFHVWLTVPMFLAVLLSHSVSLHFFSSLFCQP